MGMQRYGFLLVAIAYLAMTLGAATANLDTDEFSFIKEPYEMIGGDYTVGYLKAHEYGNAMRTVAKAYYLAWQYRPLFSPIVPDRDKELFREEERRFGYVKPVSPDPNDPASMELYKKRLIVPEPDRLYMHGAGKPLLSYLASIPQLALLKVVGVESSDLLHHQFNRAYHPVFILLRLVQIAAGLATAVILHRVMARKFDPDKAILGAALFALFPTSVIFFPNLHHDPLMVPFLLLAAVYFVEERHVPAGLAFGLALATKNTAIFMLPAAGVFLLWELYSTRQSQGWPVALASLKRRSKGVLACGLVSVAVLSVFANPVSYVQEILTPITHREYDPRFENVDSFSVSAVINAQPLAFEGAAKVRPIVNLLNTMFHFQNAFLFVVPAFILILQRKNSKLALFSFLFLATSALFGLIFEANLLNYRYLLFIPFFAILVTEISDKKAMTVLLALLILYDLVLLADPLGVNRLHYQRESVTLAQFLLGK
jgi:hypothetical protein